jgi:hypothetical protein
MITFSLGNGNTVTCNQWKVFLSSAVFHVDLCGQSNAMSAAGNKCIVYGDKKQIFLGTLLMALQ